MTTPRNLLTLGALALSVFTGFAADAPKKAEAKKPEAKKAAKPTGKYMDMDYGRFLSASIDNALGKNPFENKGCAANKAVLVNLGKEDAGYAFDTETLRGAGLWSGGWFKRKGVTFDGAHGPNPAPAEGSDLYVETNPGPGWSQNGSFAEPRKLPVGPAGVMSPIPLGPLPREHSKYLGLYLSGDRVTFAYTVGGASLLESAELETIDGVKVLSRSFTVVSGDLAESVRLANLPYGGSMKAEGLTAALTLSKGKPGDELPTAVAVHGVSGALSNEGDILVLKPGKVAAGKSFKVSFAHGGKDADALQAAQQDIRSLNRQLEAAKTDAAKLAEAAKVAAPEASAKAQAAAKAGQTKAEALARSLADAQSAAAQQLTRTKEALAKAAAGAAQPTDLRAFTKGGPSHWKEEVVTEGVLGEVDQAKQADSVKELLAKATDANKKAALQDKLAEILNAPYLVDNVTVPETNPYKAWIRVGALAFFKDGRIAFSTWSGDVWIGKVADANLSKISWRRHATGIFHALGLTVVNEELYVLGRDQITRLKDLDGDGEADFYENFNNDVQVTSNFHEFTFDLQTDSQGNFYFLKGGPVNPGGRGWGPLSDHHGCIFKVSADGKKFEVYATGIRAPNGMGVGPNGEISNGDNQGTWVPADYIHLSKPGEFVEVPDLSHQTPAPTKYSPHLCWLPYDVDNSNGGQTWVTSKQWGPFEGRMLYLSYGKSSLFGVLQERVGDVAQGGVVKFPLKFTTGLMRGRFSPVDGQLYTSGLKGWQTNGVKDGAIHRVRYTGKSVTMQETLHVTTQGITIGFTGALDPKSAGDLQNYSIEQYNYLYSGAYGSADYKVSKTGEKPTVSKPGEKGTDPVAIKSVKVSADGKTVFLEVPGLKPVEQMRIKMNVKAVDGTRVPDEVCNTINVVPEKQGSDYRSFAK